MGLGTILKSIFGGGSDAADTAASSAEPEDYKGFTIEPSPIKEGSQYRTAGFISAERDGERKRIQYIRADNNADQDAAIEHSRAKGRQIIDEQGEALLTKAHL